MRVDFYVAPRSGGSWTNSFVKSYEWKFLPKRPCTVIIPSTSLFGEVTETVESEQPARVLVLVNESARVLRDCLLADGWKFAADKTD